CGVASLAGIGVAFIGTVGSSRRSCVASTASYPARTRRRRFCALAGERAREPRVAPSARAPAEVLRLGREAAAVTVERIPAENRGDLERIGEFIRAIAPAHRAVEQARDRKPLMCAAGA